ncbi:MAG: hypothetical protein JW940_24315 [Polyangiaceae bacterium]|nr:hypothetical protein [Polyangiaceae bacterium]
MGNLAGFAAYVDDRKRVVAQVEKRLLDLQKKYESFFQEVSAVRRSELAQLSAHFAERRGRLPDGLDTSLDAAKAEAGAHWARTLAAHEAEHARYAAEAEAARSAALAIEQEAHQENVDLDAEEEELKARSERVCADIQSFTARIREASRGLGFIFRLPELRSLQAERQRLEREQLDLAARIEALRARWEERAPQHRERAAEQEAQWVALTAKAQREQTQIEYLLEAADQLVAQTALERVLFERVPEGPAEGAPNSNCPRCGVLNTARFFCAICAARLSTDRPDLEGSLLEVAELNQHFERFSEGMRACQELIGLVRGIRSGLQSFARSVQSMVATQERYPVRALRIDVPPAVVEQGRQFDALLAAVSDPQQLHPAAFAAMVGRASAAFGQEALKHYFETMGHELSVQAKAQWG